LAAKMPSYNRDLVLSELEKAVGRENVYVDEADRKVYSTDIYWLPQLYYYYGLKRTLPEFVLLPGSKEEVSEVLKIANRHSVPVVPWSGGSGVQGGAMPTEGCILLDVKRMDRIVEVDDYSLTVTAEAGVVSQDLEWELNKLGYTYGHYPASMYSACLGGMLAARSAGVMSTKYGKIEDMVLGLEVVLPTGEIIETPVSPRKTKAIGPDLSQLFVGSEGTLGVITKATLQIHPMPEERRFRAFLFKDLHSGLEAVRKFIQKGVTPCVVRLYDEVEASKKTKHRTLATGIDVPGSFLVLSFDGYKELIDLEEKIAVEICLKEGGEDLGSEPGRYWWDHRYDSYYPPTAPAVPLIFGTMDVAATFSNLEKVYYAMKKALTENFEGALFTGHFSHWSHTGGMLYPRFYIQPLDDPKEAAELYERVWNVGVSIALRNGALLNDHHGIGVKLARFMEDQWGSAFKVLKVIKDALDPNHIMNPGKLRL